jgi:hypothetical protein
MQKCKTYFTGEITLHVEQILIQNSCKTVYPRNMVCFRHIIVNTVHKGDNKGDDDNVVVDDDDNNNNN